MKRIDEIKRAADRAYRNALRSGMKREGDIFLHAAIQAIDHENPEFFNAIAHMKRIPVSIDEFMDSEDFLKGAGFEIWPTLREDLRTICPDVLVGEEPVHEAMFGGATGTGKTFLAQANNMYQAYMLTCFERPQVLYGLTHTTPIVFILQSTSNTVTKRVIYEPLRLAFTSMKYTQKYVEWDKYKESELKLQGGITIVPALASLQSLLGQAVIGGILDEVNFMAIVENSKLVAGANGQGGRYDQAEEVYYNIARRRKRSYTTRGLSMGTLCVASSTRYKGDFLDRRIDEVRKFNEPNVRTFRRRQYEVNPRFADGKFDTFKIIVGNEDTPTMILEDYMLEGQHYRDGATILEVPLPYKPDFQKNPDGALRDVVGIATDAITPFFRRRQKIVDCLARGVDRGLLPLVDKEVVELAVDGMPMWLSENMPGDAERQKPHFVHIDLSRTADRCGVALVRFDGMVNVPRPGDPNVLEVLPKFTVLMAVGLKPSPIREVDIPEVRNWVLQLVSLYGFNIQSVTFDGFDSAESVQVLRKAGIVSDVVSMDRTTDAYDALRDVIYSDRLDMQPDCELAKTELVQLEYYAEKRKVDHPPRGSKDVADAITGAVYTAMKSRGVRTKVDHVDTSNERVKRRKGIRVKTRTRRKS